MNDFDNSSPLESMKLHLAVCEDDANVKTPTFKNTSLATISNQFNNPKHGAKGGSYFLRTTVVDESIRGRSNANTSPTSSLLIIDADSSIDPQTGNITSGAPDAAPVHEMLKLKGINHFIYRSWSHGLPNKGNRYRILIPTARPYTKEELPELINQALFLCGGRIAPVKENLSWSQPWYFPRINKDCEVTL